MQWGIHTLLYTKEAERDKTECTLHQYCLLVWLVGNRDTPTDLNQILINTLLVLTVKCIIIYCESADQCITFPNGVHGLRGLDHTALMQLD